MLYYDMIGFWYLSWYAYYGGTPLYGIFFKNRVYNLVRWPMPRTRAAAAGSLTGDAGGINHAGRFGACTTNSKKLSNIFHSLISMKSSYCNFTDTVVPTCYFRGYSSGSAQPSLLQVRTAIALPSPSEPSEPNRQLLP